MRRFLLLTIALAFLAGCGLKDGRVGVALPPGIIYENTIAPLTFKRSGPDRGASVVIPDNLRRGEATAYSLDLGLPGIPGGFYLSSGWGRMDLQQALDNGGIGEVVYADGETLKILRIFTRTTIIVYGTPAES